MTDTTKERAPMKNRDLIAEIARELYDRFVMGGWEPQDAYVQIDEWLGRAEQSTDTPPLEEIRGAVARGWCHYPNTAKEFDGDLAEAISKEIVKLLAEQSTETPSADELIELLEDCLDCLRMEFGDCDGCTTDPCTQCRAKALIRNSSIVAEAPRPVGTPEKCPTCGQVAAAEAERDRAVRALQECYIAIGATILGTSSELCPELKDQLAKAGNMARAALSPVPVPAKDDAKDRAERALEFLKSYNRGIYDCAIKVADEPVPVPAPTIIMDFKSGAINPGNSSDIWNAGPAPTHVCPTEHCMDDRGNCCYVDEAGPAPKGETR